MSPVTIAGGRAACGVEPSEVSNVIRSHVGIDHARDARSVEKNDALGWWDALRTFHWGGRLIQMEPRNTPGSLIPPTLTAGVYGDIQEASGQLLRSSRIIHPGTHVAEQCVAEGPRCLDRWGDIDELS